MQKDHVKGYSIPSGKMGGGRDFNLIKDNSNLQIAIYQKTQREDHKFNVAYADYLNTLVNTEDTRYLRSEKFAHRLVPLRAKVGQVVLSPSEFKLTQATTLKSSIPLSNSPIVDDPLINALVERKKLNATKTISTIVFISTRDTKGFAVSGYIDLEQSIRRFEEGDIRSHPWEDIYAGQRRLQPNKGDLSFIAWKNNKVFHNDSDNYKVTPDAALGLCFMYKGDGSLICIEKYITEDHPSCTYIESQKHGSAIIYDHRIRRKL